MTQKACLWTKKVNLNLSKKDADSKTILLVDDHLEVREFISSQIKYFFRIIEAENGLKALKVSKNEPIDLVITDLMMSWMDGLE